MKARYQKTVECEMDIHRVRVTVPFEEDYEEDAPDIFPSGFPRKDFNPNREQITFEILADTGKILGWPKGERRDVCIKVRDSGIYQLLGQKGEPLAIIKEDYVPHGVVPGSYGDYLEFTVNSLGVIEEWPSSFDISEFKVLD